MSNKITKHQFRRSRSLSLKNVANLENSLDELVKELNIPQKFPGHVADPSDNHELTVFTLAGCATVGILALMGTPIVL